MSAVSSARAGDLEVDLFCVGSDPLLASVGAQPRQQLAPASRDGVARLVRRDHAFHAGRRAVAAKRAPAARVSGRRNRFVALSKPAARGRK